MRAGTINANGISLETLESGNSRDLTIVFCHGNSSSALSFRPQLAGSLKDIAHLVSISLPGHGNSQRASSANSYDIRHLGDALLESVKMQSAKSVILCGHSLGGHLFSQILPRCSNVTGLVLVSAPPLSIATLASTFSPDPTDGAMFSAELSEAQIEKFSGALLHCPPADPQDLATLRNSVLRTTGAFRPSLGACLAAGAFLDELEHLESASVPVAIVGGERDPFIQSDTYKTLSFAKLWRNKAVVFKDAGHSPHLESVNAFEIFMRSFVDSIHIGTP